MQSASGEAQLYLPKVTPRVPRSVHAKFHADWQFEDKDLLYASRFPGLRGSYFSPPRGACGSAKLPMTWIRSIIIRFLFSSQIFFLFSAAKNKCFAVAKMFLKIGKVDEAAEKSEWVAVKELFICK